MEPKSTKPVARQSKNPTNAMTILGNGDCEMSENNSRSVDFKKKDILQREASNGSLEYLPNEEQDGASGICADWESRPSSGGWRPRSSGGYRPDSGSSRRTPTPTKFVKLEAPRVKNSSQEADYGNDPDWRKSVEEENRQTERYKAEREQQKQQNTPLSNGLHTPGAEPVEAWGKADRASGKREQPKHTTARTKHSCVASTSVETKQKVKQEKKTEESCDVQDTEEGEDEEEEEMKKAPNELLMEFVESVIAEDYQNAQKLCKMILMYEPDNPEALKFGPLIEERLKLDEESDTSDEEDSDDEDDDDEDEEDSEEEENKDEEGSEEESEEAEGSTEADDEEDEDGKWMELATQWVEQMKLQQQQLEDDI